MKKFTFPKKHGRIFENGITKLDLERLQQIADVLEMSLIDLINAQESFYVHQVNDKPNVGFSAKEVIIHNDVSESERKMFDKLIAEKDEQLKLVREELKETKAQLNELITKLAGKL